MQDNQQNSPVTNQAAPNPEIQHTKPQVMDIPEHAKTSPVKKILIISFGFLFFSALIIAGYYLYTLLVTD